MNYTKGPWKVQPLTLYCHKVTPEAKSLGEHITNSDLISAAPEMYEALKLIQKELLGSNETYNGLGLNRFTMVSAVNNAIAKAEGSEDERNYSK